MKNTIRRKNMKLTDHESNICQTSKEDNDSGCE